MTTDKKRVTIWLRSTAELETLYDALRTAAPLAMRGAISRSTIAEAAISLALQDWQVNGIDSAIAKTTVTLP